MKSIYEIKSTASTTMRNLSQMQGVYNVLQQIAQKYSLPLINIMYESGISDYTRSTFQPIDGLHCGQLGYELIARFVANQIKSKYRYFD
jgi:lysophospholipase L1-like esterase